MAQYEDAAQALARWQRVERVSSDPVELTRQLIVYAVLASHRHVFGVVFYFALFAALGLGPTGAVVFRLSEFVHRSWTHQAEDMLIKDHELAKVSKVAWHAVDWLSVRVTALMFAISGNFEDAMDAWRTRAVAGTYQMRRF